MIDRKRSRPALVLLATAALAAGAVTAAWAASGDGDEERVDRERAVVDWFDDRAVAVFEGGWSVTSMEGDAPLLEVRRQGVPVGSVEALAFPVDSFDGGANLDALVRDFYEQMARDRRAGCGYEIATATVRKASVGGQTGVAYGFNGPVGAPSERTVSYATVVDDQIVLIVASAHDPGGCIGTDEELVFTTDVLAQFVPLLDRIVADTPLPLAFFAPDGEPGRAAVGDDPQVAVGEG